MSQQDFKYKNGIVSIVNGRVSDYLFKNENGFDAFIFLSRFNTIVESDSLQQDLIFGSENMSKGNNYYDLLSRKIPDFLDEKHKKHLISTREELGEKKIDLDSLDFLPVVLTGDDLSVYPTSEIKIRLMYVNFLLPKSPDERITSYVTRTALEKCWSIPPFAKSVAFPLIGYIPFGPEVEKYLGLMLDEFKGHLNGEIRTHIKNCVLKDKPPLEKLGLILYNQPLYSLAVNKAEKIFS